jgi:hypothetical protein
MAMHDRSTWIAVFKNERLLEWKSVLANSANISALALWTADVPREFGTCS